jgi:hypothetical protein
MVQLHQLAESDLPPEPPASRDHILKCLRAMDASLPRRNQDETGGKLLAETYARMLSSYSVAAINYLAREAIHQCDWFPTVRRCEELLSGYNRNDEALHLQIEARNLLSKRVAEKRANLIEALEQGRVAQDKIDTMPPAIREDMRKVGVLRWDAEANQFVSCRREVVNEQPSEDPYRPHQQLGAPDATGTGLG